MKKTVLLDETSILQKKQKIDETQEFVSNFNENNCITQNTRLIIVGTITPPEGVKNGYFYTASRNQIYRLIDEALQTNLVLLKKSLPKTTTDREQIVAQIVDVLQEKHIAFLDIMKYAIRTKNKSSDDDIQYYTLDTASFKNISESVCFICNSKLAEEGYLQICKELQRTPNYEYLAQSWPHLYKNRTQEKWIETIKKHCS